MLARLQESLQDGIALRGVLEAHALEVLMQNLLGRTHHLAGDGRLVVNAPLQHGHLNDNGVSEMRQVLGVITSRFSLRSLRFFATSRLKALPQRTPRLHARKENHSR